MTVEFLSALVFFSPAPEPLAAFYRTHLGIPFEHHGHGPIRDHLEADLGGVHMAVLKGRAPARDGGGVAPTFRVEDLDAAVGRLRASDVHPTRKILELGDGKRVATYRDPDGNTFSLIEVRSSPVE
jgi:predicted enzyme related to lactoylglutathione lyase